MPRALAFSPTLCRLEQRAHRQTAVGIHQLLVEQFIASFKEAPSESILDFDATDDRVHGNQEGGFFLFPREARSHAPKPQRGVLM